MQEACSHRVGLSQMRPPCKDLTTAVLSRFAPWQQLILARHMSGAFMSGAEKSTWSSQVSQECQLCGELDTKHHRLYTCQALATVREAHLDILEVSEREFPHWTHLLVGTQHPDASLFRLSCQSRRLPPLVPAPVTGRVQIFTDGLRGTPRAQLPGSPAECEAWRQRPCTERAATFRVLVQGCTPGSQTVPVQSSARSRGWRAGSGNPLP